MMTPPIRGTFDRRHPSTGVSDREHGSASGGADASDHEDGRAESGDLDGGSESGYSDGGAGSGNLDGGAGSPDGGPAGDGSPAPPTVDAEAEIPEDHPRYQDLVSRHRIEEGVREGITHLQGMHAEGRGSAFDYLLGEETIPSADRAARACAACLLTAEQPVLSVNGNVAALVPGELVELAEVVDADLEVNLFNRSEDRIDAIVEHLEAHGATDVLGQEADASIPGLEHGRGQVAKEGIYSADVVVVPLEDGDRAAALEDMGKTEVVIDLNPLSRSAQVADIPIVDNILRAVPNVTAHARALATEEATALQTIVAEFAPDEHLSAAEARIRGSDSLAPDS